MEYIQSCIKDQKHHEYKIGKTTKKNRVLKKMSNKIT